MLPILGVYSIYIYPILKDVPNISNIYIYNSVIYIYIYVYVYSEHAPNIYSHYNHTSKLDIPHPSGNQT